MMKKVMFFLLLLPFFAHSQWLYNGNHIYYNNGYVGVGTAGPRSLLDVGAPSLNTLTSVLGRLPEGDLEGVGTYLGVNTYNTQPWNDCKSFALEHRFYGALNNAINFYRGMGATGGYMTFATNNGTEQMRIGGNGNVGMGTTLPQTRLDIRGDLTIETGRNPMIYTGVTDVGVDLNRYLLIINSVQYTSASGLKAGGLLIADSYDYANPSKNDLVVKGNTCIGTNDAKGYKLAVNGAIRAKKVVVTQTDWPDYVFDSSYQLPSLDSVSSFIQVNKHLPDMPSAAVVEKDGHDLGEVQKLLLKKMEEMTLYMIEIKKENAHLKNQNEQLIKEVDQLKTLLKK